MNPPSVKVPAAVYCMKMVFPPPTSGTQERKYPVITPLRSVGAGKDQENVTFLALRWVTVKLCGGPLGAGDEMVSNCSQLDYNYATFKNVTCYLFQL